jgi:hypothetical protein
VTDIHAAEFDTIQRVHIQTATGAYVCPDLFLCSFLLQHDLIEYVYSSKVILDLATLKSCLGAAAV